MIDLGHISEETKGIDLPEEVEGGEFPYFE